MAILERYGMTETGMNTSNPLDGARVPGTVGYALPQVDVRVADDEGRPLPAGEAGVLEVRGPNVFSGYWRQPEKTAAEFRADGFFITGDIARMDADGRVAIVGRARDLIISGGFNVYPKEVELVLDEVPGVRESAVIGLAHPDFGEAVAAVVVPEDGAAPAGGGGGDRRPGQGRARQLQDAQAGVPGRPAAPQRHGQGAKERAARAHTRTRSPKPPTPAIWYMLVIYQNLVYT